MEDFEIVSTQFPPGFRFFPTDQELIVHYLRKKVYTSLTPANYIIADIDLYKFNPWELPVKAFFGEGEWFFFSPRDRKYPNGSRPNRSAGSGYWKATGSDKPILDIGGSQCIGVKKSLVFYKGRPPKGMKTEWVMHEYRLLDAQPSSTSKKHKCSSMRLDDWVLCRVKNKGIMQIENVEQIEKRATVTTEQEALLQMNASPDEWSENRVHGFASHGSISSSETFNFDLGIEPMHRVSSLLESINRELSFGTLDELMLLAPNNFHEACEQNNFHEACEQFSWPASSNSESPEFSLDDCLT